MRCPLTFLARVPCMQKEKGSQQLLLVDKREWSCRLVGEKGDDGDDGATKCWCCGVAML